MSKKGRPIALSATAPAEPTESQATQDFEVEASLMLKRHMFRLDWTYQDLAKALQPLGITRTAAVLNRRINRGNFSAGFLLACLAAMGIKNTFGPEVEKAESV